MKEPRTSTFSVDQQVEAKHSNPKYDKRRGKVVDKTGGGVYSIEMLERTRTINGPTGKTRSVTDTAETKDLKLGSLQLLAAVVAKAAQGSLFE